MNRTQLLRNVNQSLAEKGLDVRVRYNREWREWQVTYQTPNGRDFAPADSFIDAVEMVLYVTFNGPAFTQFPR